MTERNRGICIGGLLDGRVLTSDNTSHRVCETFRDGTHKHHDYFYHQIGDEAIWWNSDFGSPSEALSFMFSIYSQLRSDAAD